MKSFNGVEYQVRGGAWADPMNSCFWQFVSRMPGGYILCQDNATGEYFVMYLPYYQG